jgi:hypothetical protein
VLLGEINVNPKTILMLNKENYSTDNLEYFISKLFAIYRRIEFELKQNERNQDRIQNLIHELDTTFNEMPNHNLFNQDTKWLHNTLSNARKNRQMSEGSADAMNQLTDKLMDEMEDEKLKNVKYELFYKENGMWYISLPEFLNMGLGNKNNLLMIDGSDTFLDILSGYEPNSTPDGTKISLVLCDQEFLGYTHRLTKLNNGLNQDILIKAGHAPVDNGAYYMVEEIPEHKLWLCPVTEYVFDGEYPDKIFLRKNG